MLPNLFYKTFRDWSNRVLDVLYLMIQTFDFIMASVLNETDETRQMFKTTESHLKRADVTHLKAESQLCYL